MLPIRPCTSAGLTALSFSILDAVNKSQQAFWHMSIPSFSHAMEECANIPDTQAQSLAVDGDGSIGLE